MLVVAILVPLLLLIAAISLERFEARVLPAPERPRARRASRPSGTATADAAVVTGRHLHAVPTPDTPDDPAAEPLPRAS